MYTSRRRLYIACVALVLVFPGSSYSQDTPIGPVWWPSEWGPNDERGAANRLSPAGVLRAAQLIRTGQVYDLGHAYEEGMPNLGPRHFSLVTIGYDGRANSTPNGLVAFDVMVTGELSQVGTQFDGLGHVGVRVGGRDLFYNGFDRATFGRPRGLTRLGVEKVGPIVTRGVLIDVAAFKQLDRLPAGYVITPEDLRGALARQGVDIAPGEVALIRTGYATLWRTDNAAYIDRYAGIGMAAAEWLASRQVVMVGADNAGVNVEQEVPGRIEEIHQVLIARYGIYLLENMNLESLASDQVYEFAFVFAPLKLTGAEGAPGSPLAIR